MPVWLVWVVGFRRFHQRLRLQPGGDRKPNAEHPMAVAPNAEVHPSGPGGHRRQWQPKPKKYLGHLLELLTMAIQWPVWRV